MIAASTLDEIRTRIDIVALIGADVPLKKIGRDWYGPCPWHDGDSFCVIPGKLFWHCFSCEIAGDVFTWMQKRRGLSFKDAVRELAQQAGVHLNGTGAADMDPAALKAWKAENDAHLAAQKIERTAEQEREWAEAAVAAKARWEAASPDVPLDHPYLVRKKIPPLGARYEAAGRLIVLPLYDATTSEIVSLQTIDANGVKLNAAGARKQGTCIVLLPATGAGGKAIRGETPLYVVEGYATGVSVARATGCATAVALDTSNLPVVAKAKAARNKKARIIIAADNDAWSRTAKGKNPGITAAIAAARASGARITWPTFPGVGCQNPLCDRGKGCPAGHFSDFNDLAVHLGISAVVAQLDVSYEPDDVPRALYELPQEPPAEQQGPVRTEGVTLEDFWAYMPQHMFIFCPNGELWPATSVDSRVPWVPKLDQHGHQELDKDGEPKMQRPSGWLSSYRAVEQMTWCPGEPSVIDGRLVSGGGWIERPGCKTYNLYKPPRAVAGDPSLAGPWLEHVEKVYGAEHMEHILRWCAHRIQHPGEKINHGLVLGGLQGIGKDTLLEPLKHGVGPWNFAEVAPSHLLGRFNGFVKSVILRVSEARDLGELDRFSFYDHMKVYMASPPDVLRVDEKNIREYTVFNVCGVVITTNHKSDGIYLPADDRRHYVVWSELTKDDFAEDYWTQLWRWYAEGGTGHVIAYLAEKDLSDFDCKAPPPKTAAFYEIVDANRSPLDSEIADVLDRLRWPPAVTLQALHDAADEPLKEWIRDRRNSRQIPHRIEAAGYVAVRNPSAKDGLWRANGRRQAIYAKQELTPRDREAAAQEIASRGA